MYEGWERPPSTSLALFLTLTHTHLGSAYWEKGKVGISAGLVKSVNKCHETTTAVQFLSALNLVHWNTRFRCSHVHRVWLNIIVGLLPTLINLLCDSFISRLFISLTANTVYNQTTLSLSLFYFFPFILYLSIYLTLELLSVCLWLTAAQSRAKVSNRSMSFFFGIFDIILILDVSIFLEFVALFIK